MGHPVIGVRGLFALGNSFDTHRHQPPSRLVVSPARYNELKGGRSMVKVLDEIRKHATLGVVAKKDIKDPKLADALDHLARKEELIRIHRGVFRLFGAVDSFESKAYALTKYAGDKSATSHFARTNAHRSFRAPG